MTFLVALILLSINAFLLLSPGSLFSEGLRHGAESHRRLGIGVLALIAVLLACLQIWPGEDNRETDAEGYGEVWYMVQTNPLVRPLTRECMADGILTRKELQAIRRLYREAPEVGSMREGVLAEISQKE